MGNYTFFDRKAYGQLLEWKINSKGRTAMLIEGARRVGKSTLAKTFGEREYSVCVIVNFSTVDPRVKEFFDDLSDLDRLFRDLQVITKTEFVKRDTLIIFDEIQEFPRAREAIKTLVADGRYDYIETGSLVSIKKNVTDIVIPSEEDRIKLHPLDFEEFQWARGDRTLRLLATEISDGRPLNEAIHKQYMKSFREYMAVGGMPQAVEAFVDGSSFAEIDKIKRKILQIYIDDFIKLDGSGTLGLLFKSIPGELSRESLRFRITEMLPNSTLKRERESFSEMSESQTVEFCYHVSDPRVGLDMTIDHTFFKLFLEDTGLFVTLCFFDREASNNEVYDALVRDRLPANLGYVYENAVAQAIISSGHALRYHTFPKDDGHHHYEVDFIIGSGLKVIPVEVKSSTYKTHKSLDEFIRKHQRDVDVAYVISPKNLDKDGKIIYLPIYLAGFIR